MAIDFLIVGGGIGGAVLANLLGQRGKRVLVLEKSLTTAPPNRPEVLWPATVEVLRSLIPKDLKERWLLPLRGFVAMYKEQPLIQFGPEVFREAGVQPCSTAHTRELLMRQAPCDYQRGMEVTAVLRDRDRVVGVRARNAADDSERDILADWTIGDDGVHSVIRQDCGLPMTLVPFPLNALSFAFDWPASLPAATVRIWLNEDRVRAGVPLMGAIPLPGGKGVALIPVWPNALDNERRLQQTLRAFIARDPLMAEVAGERMYPRGMTRIRLAWGRTPRFGTAGALLMGDAAHPVTPAGGQGANASVADALVLGEVALRQPSQLLTEYQRRRRPAAYRSLGLSRGAARIFGLPPPVLHVGLVILPWAARWLNRRPERFGGLLRTAAEAFRERPHAGG